MEQKNYTMTTVCTTVQDRLSSAQLLLSNYTPSIALRKRTNFVRNGHAEKRKGERKEERKKGEKIGCLK
jgi:hypothetical protein